MAKNACKMSAFKNRKNEFLEYLLWKCAVICLNELAQNYNRIMVSGDLSGMVIFDHLECDKIWKDGHRIGHFS